MFHNGSDSAQGAEAVITETTYLGWDAVVKSRPPKTYRLPELDAHIRSSRTRNEARIMHRPHMPRGPDHIQHDPDR